MCLRKAFRAEEHNLCGVWGVQLQTELQVETGGCELVLTTCTTKDTGICGTAR